MRWLSSSDHLKSPRTRRAVGLLLGLWLLGGIDYGFTVWAQRYTPLEEVNPWASSLLDQHHFASLAVSKVLLTFLATVIFWRLRHRAVTQVSLWVLVAVHVALMVQWSNYTADALELAHATQMQPDGRVTSISYLPAVIVSPPSSLAPKEQQVPAGVDQPAPGAPDHTWQLAVLPPHGQE
jgi:glucan phosphoethanolaminetransferase (alkaline phosphatase superfamily)